jgi:hypothetical protein
MRPLWIASSARRGRHRRSTIPTSVLFTRSAIRMPVLHRDGIARRQGRPTRRRWRKERREHWFLCGNVVFLSRSRQQKLPERQFTNTMRNTKGGKPRRSEPPACAVCILESVPSGVCQALHDGTRDRASHKRCARVQSKLSSEKAELASHQCTKFETHAGDAPSSDR